MIQLLHFELIYAEMSIIFQFHQDIIFPAKLKTTRASDNQRDYGCCFGWDFNFIAIPALRLTLIFYNNAILRNMDNNLFIGILNIFSFLVQTFSSTGKLLAVLRKIIRLQKTRIFIFIMIFELDCFVVEIKLTDSNFKCYQWICYSDFS